MPVESFSARLWSALANPVGGPDGHPVPADAKSGTRMWAALTRSAVPVVDEYRHDGARRGQKQAKRFAAAAGLLSAKSGPVTEWTAIAELVALADEYEPLRQRCIDVLCSFLRTTGSVDARAYPALEVRHALLDVIAARIAGRATVSWPRSSFTFAGMTLESLDFSSALIDGTADFSGCRFGNGKSSFAGARFSGRTSFADSVFSGSRVDFSHAQFDGDVKFSDCVFDSGTVSFIGAQFSGNVSFTGCAFVGADIEFGEACFSGGLVDFTNCAFKAGVVTFEGAHFKGGMVDLHALRVVEAMPVFEDWMVEDPPQGLLLPHAA